MVSTLKKKKYTKKTKKNFFKNILSLTKKKIKKITLTVNNFLEDEMEHFAIFKSIFELGTYSQNRVNKIITLLDSNDSDINKIQNPVLKLDKNNKKNIFLQIYQIKNKYTLFKKIVHNFSKFNDSIRRYNDSIIMINSNNIETKSLRRFQIYLYLVSSIYQSDKLLFKGHTLEQMLVNHKQPKIKMTADNFHKLYYSRLFLINPCYESMHLHHHSFRSSFGITTPLFLIFQRDRELIITIQGTWRIIDVLSNLNGKSILFSKIFENKKVPASFKFLRDCHVHNQLAKNAFKIYELILHILPTKRIRNIDKISICGHSMGGSISSILGLLIYFNILSKKIKLELKVITFNTASSFNNDSATEKIREIIRKNNKSPKELTFQIKNVFYRQDSVCLFNQYSFSIFLSILFSTKIKKTAENFKYYLDRLKNSPDLKFNNELMEPFYVNKDQNGVITDYYTFFNPKEYIIGSLPFLLSFYTDDHTTSNFLNST